MSTTLLTILYAFAVAAGSDAPAASIVNTDAKKYTLDISCDGMTSHPTIAPKATLADVLSEGCTVKIQDGASFTVKNTNNLVIVKGKLTESAKS